MSRATDAKQHDVEASLMGQFEREETFLKPYKHNIYYYFKKNSCVGDIGDIGTVTLHTCCITHINE